MKYLVILIFLLGCESLPKISRLNPNEVKSGGVGFTAGVITEQTRQSVKEAFTPKYKLNFFPPEFCQANNPAPGMIYCYLIPCPEDKEASGDCERTISIEDFFEQNKIVFGMETTLKNINSSQAFCENNIDFCIDYLGNYADQKIILKVKE